MSAPVSAAISTFRPEDPSRRLHSVDWLHRRRDQLDGVVAVPFRRPGNGGDLAALAVDQHRGRHPQRPAYGLKILKNLGFLIAEITEPGQIGLLQEILRLFGIAGIDVDGDHLEIRAAEPGLQALERGHLLAAGHAPGGPQVHQHRAPAPVGELFGLAVGVLEGEVRQLQGRRRHGQRGDFAMRQRRELARKIDRRAAGGVAGCVAFQAANPVYPGKSNRRPDQHRPDRKGNPARGGGGRRGQFGHIVCHPVSDTAMQSGSACSRQRHGVSVRGCDDEWQVMSNKS